MYNPIFGYFRFTEEGVFGGDHPPHKNPPRLSIFHGNSHKHFSTISEYPQCFMKIRSSVGFYGIEQ
jgi:hypothetical protein